MAFANRLSERMEELRFPSVRSPGEESPYSTFTSPPRADNSFFSAFQQQPSADSRGSLQRRFTTDSSKISGAFGQGYNPSTPSRTGAGEITQRLIRYNFRVSKIEDRLRVSADLRLRSGEGASQKPRPRLDIELRLICYNFTSLFFAVSLVVPLPAATTDREQNPNQAQIDQIREQRRKAEAQLKQLDEQQKMLEGSAGSAFAGMSLGPNRISLNGPVSEPTTPPEYASGYAKRYSQNRMSISNVTSPPGFSSRYSQSSTQIASPVGSQYNSNGNYGQTPKSPAKSMPVSRRGSDEDESYPEELPAMRSNAYTNRFSMPARTHRSSQRLSMGNENTMRTLSTQGPPISTSFLNDDDDDHRLSLNGVADMVSPIAKAYAQLGGDNGFPTLTKTSDGLKTNSAALDLANSKSAEDENWLAGSRVRPNHHSMPQTDSSMYRPVLSNLNSPPSERSAELSGGKPQRLSMGFSFYDDSKDGQAKVPSANSSLVRPPLPESSYSTPAVLTMKSGSFEQVTTPPKSHAEQQFHNHNVSMGRIPANSLSNRQSRDLPTNMMANLKLDDKQQFNGQALSQAQAQSNLQASAAPFGPSFSSTSDAGMISMTSPMQTSFATPQTYPFNMQNFNVSQMANPQLGINGPHGAFSPQTASMYGQYANGNGLSQYGKGLIQDGPTRGNSRRAHNNIADDGRYNNVPLESYCGTMYEMCKDQHGCRYMQRKLEEGNAEHIQLIFLETCPHIIELMTDPFGNYLCQKLFEHCNDEQRTQLINSASPALTSIALNQHGTRALQKMIEYVNTDEQVETIVQSLNARVVELVQDLNGNHVVQKCLNRLGAERCQFIYDAVGTHCVIVGTHRHGCCVLQRCIDHAAGYQRAQLIARITHCAFDLVQDPFGNYVVQYILDLDEPQFTQPLCMSFLGKIAPLSKQKFSSNVIEKCLRTADPETKRALIDEMIMGNELEKMLRDSFANYVVQTALDYADPITRARIVECVKPILPHIKQTPHGRRIATKILGADTTGGRLSGNSSGQMTPNDSFSAAGSLSGRNGPTGSGRRQVQIVGGGFNTPRFNGAPNGNGMDSQYGANGYNASVMNGHATADEFESPAAMYNAQTFGAQNPYSAFQGQMGSNYF